MHWKKISAVMFFAVTNSASASNLDTNSYCQAARTAAVVQAMKSGVPAQEIKEALLNRTRSEDREFAKSILVHWKKNSEQNITSEFNRMIIRDREGKETLIMMPLENTPNQFQINGVTWTLPEKGSVAQSLKKTLLQKETSKKSVSIFNLVTPAAYASEASTPIMTAAFIYAFTATDGGPPHTANTHLQTYSPAKLLLPTEGGLLRKIADRIRGKSQVTCGAESATGRMLISNQPVNFVVKRDGSAILTPFDSKQSVKVSSGVTNIFGAAALYDRSLKFEPCLDSKCEKTVGHPRHSMKSFLRPISDQYVEQATTFRPRDADQPTYPIDFVCEDESDCNEVGIKDLERLSSSDAHWAVKYRDEANESLRKTRAEQNEHVLSIRPLFACCQDKACRTAILEQGVQLKTKSTGSRTSGGSTAP